MIALMLKMGIFNFYRHFLFCDGQQSFAALQNYTLILLIVMHD